MSQQENVSKEDLEKRLADLQQENMQLREAASLYQNILDNLPGGVLVYDNNGYLVNANKRFEEYFGISNLSQYYGQFNVLRDKFADNLGIRQKYERAYNGEVVNESHVYNFAESDFDLTHRHDVRKVNEKIYPYISKGKIKNVVAVTQDVTEHDHSEQRLQESELFFKLLVDSAPYPIFIQAEGQFEYVNEAAVKLYGASSAQAILDTPVIDCVHPECRTLVYERMQALIDDQTELVQLNCKHIGMDKSVIDVEISALPLCFNMKKGILVFIHDITTQKKYEEEIKRSYNLLNNLAEQVPGVIYQYRLYPDGRSCFPYSSSGMYSIFECSSDEVRLDGSPVLRRIHPDDVDRVVAAILESAKNQTMFQSEFRVILPGQGLRWRYCHSNPTLLDDGSTLWHGIITDITDHKNIEIEIKKRDEQFENFFNNAIDLLAITSKNGDIERVNKEWENVLGYTVEELVGRNITSLIHPEDTDGLNEIGEDLRKGEDVNGLVVRFVCITGTSRWIEWKLFPYGDSVYAYGRDVTDNKESRDQLLTNYKILEETEIKLRARNEELSKTYVTLRDQERRLVYSNKELESMLELHKSLEERLEFALNAIKTGAWELDLHSLNIERTLEHDKIFGYQTMQGVWNYDIMMEHVLADDHFIVLESFKESLQNKTMLDFECRIKSCDGTIKTIWMRGKHVMDKIGHSDRITGIIQDITNSKLAKSELIEARLKAEESDMLKSAFMQNMSHEIRTPMNGIIGFVELLRNHAISEEKRVYYLDMVAKSSNQLLRVVTDIITISSLHTNQEKLNIKLVNINHIINNLYNKFKSGADAAGIQLIRMCPLEDAAAEILTDEVRLTQVITNLMLNASKFTKEGYIEFGYIVRKEILEFYVKDTGIGVSPEQHKVIFERFRQADLSISRMYGGTGLGLSISKGLVELLGGQIWIDPEQKKGAKFCFTIPYSRVSKISDAGGEISGNDRLSILVAEDELVNYLLLKEILPQKNFHLEYAKNGYDAVEYCKTNTVDVILMDIKMPVMDGYEATRLIKASYPDIKIVACTAYALPEEVGTFNDRFDGYITKPVKRSELLSILANFVKEQKGGLVE